MLLPVSRQYIKGQVTNDKGVVSIELPLGLKVEQGKTDGDGSCVYSEADAQVCYLVMSAFCLCEYRLCERY